MDIKTPLSEIVSDIHAKYYGKPYPSGSARELHDITHAVRAMIFGTMARRLMALDGQEIKEDELELIQVALLLHDAGRQDESDNRWDAESGVILYHYLVESLKVDPSKAKMVAQARVNKDWKPGDKTYLTLQTNDKNKAVFYATALPPELSDESLRMSQSIQFGDCVDIYRVMKEKFNTENLKYYQDEIDKKSVIADIIEKLLSECFNLIDASRAIKNKPSQAFDNLTSMRDSYSLMALIESGDQSVETLALKLKPQTPDPIVNAYQSHDLLFRGITTPNKMYSYKNYAHLDPHYTFVDHEIRKTLRRIGIPTWSVKNNRAEKEFNKSRSCSIVSRNTGIYSEVGGAFIVKAENLICANTTNLYSGSGKKSRYQQASRGTLVAQKEFRKVREHVRFGWGRHLHNEIISDIEHWDCIYYSEDAGSNDMSTPEQRFLTAVFLRDIYIKQSKLVGEAITLPIYALSMSQDSLTPVEDINKKIINSVESEFRRYLDKIISGDRQNAYARLISMSTRECLSEALYQKDSVSLDSYYEDSLKNHIMERLEVIKQNVLQQSKHQLMSKESTGVKDNQSVVSKGLISLLKNAEIGVDEQSAKVLFSSVLNQIQSDPENTLIPKWILKLKKIAEKSSRYSAIFLEETKQYFQNDLKLSTLGVPALLGLLQLVHKLSPHNEQWLSSLFYSHLDHLLKSSQHSKIECLLSAEKISDIPVNEFFTDKIKHEIIDAFTRALHSTQDLSFESLSDPKISYTLSELLALFQNALDNNILPQAKTPLNQEQSRILKLIQWRVLYLSRTFEQGQAEFFKTHFKEIKQILNHDYLSSDNNSSGLHHQYSNKSKYCTPLAHLGLCLSSGKNTQRSLRELTALEDELSRELAINLNPEASSGLQHKPE